MDSSAASDHLPHKRKRRSVYRGSLTKREALLKNQGRGAWSKAESELTTRPGSTRLTHLPVRQSVGSVRQPTRPRPLEWLRRGAQPGRAASFGEDARPETSAEVGGRHAVARDFLTRLPRLPRWRRQSLMVACETP
jgi:hypothetical protein